MQVSILASSSQGNATFIKTAKHKILVDAGFSGKKLESLMNGIGESLQNIDSVFITHEHSDHIKGLGVLMRKYPVNVYANQKTWSAITEKSSMGELPREQMQILEANQSLCLDDVDVESFSVSHDAIDPQFYQFASDNKRMTLLTDTGYVNERLLDRVKGSDAYLLEFNHDTMMLRDGPYSWSLKQRILSDSGHLSNTAGAKTLIDLVDRHTKKVFLGHLSPHNNTKTLAHNSADEACFLYEPEVNSDFEILNTDPASPQDLFTL